MYVQLSIESLSCNHCCSGTAISITYSEVVFVALVIHYAVRMHHFVICGLLHSTIFFHIITQTTRFLKKLFDREWELRFSIKPLSVTLLILWNFEPDVIINMYIGFYIKYPLFLSDYNESWIFSTDFRKIIKYQISWKSLYLESTSSMRTDGWADRQTDRHDEANTRVCQSCERTI
jgi:hypothetical protein